MNPQSPTPEHQPALSNAEKERIQRRLAEIEARLIELISAETLQELRQVIKEWEGQAAYEAVRPIVEDEVEHALNNLKGVLRVVLDELDSLLHRYDIRDPVTGVDKPYGDRTEPGINQANELLTGIVHSPSVAVRFREWPKLATPGARIGAALGALYAHPETDLDPEALGLLYEEALLRDQLAKPRGT